MESIGHNQPPEMLVAAIETIKDLSSWMAEMPVVETEEEARDAKLYLDRGKLCLKDLDDERVKKVGPLNEQVKEINSHYKRPKEALEKVVAQLGSRLSDFIRKETAKRVERASEAKRLAEEAERKAREAENAEQLAIESVNAGVLGVDVATVVVEANDSFREAQVAARSAARAERETHVKVAGGFTKAVSLRQKEILIISDPLMAIGQIGFTEDIREAMLKGARAYRKLHNRLPDGIKSEIKEEI